MTDIVKVLEDGAYPSDNGYLLKDAVAEIETLRKQVALYQSDAERIWALMPELRNTDSHYAIHEAVREKLEAQTKAAELAYMSSEQETLDKLEAAEAKNTELEAIYSITSKALYEEHTLRESAEARAAMFKHELNNIATANIADWEPEMKGQFKEWAQSRAYFISHLDNPSDWLTKHDSEREPAIRKDEREKAAQLADLYLKGACPASSMALYLPDAIRAMKGEKP